MIPHYHEDHTLMPTDGTNVWVWVFGSNEAGRHGKGAAKVAREHYMALYGVGHGPQGASYAIPTKSGALKPLPLLLIKANVTEFLHYALLNPGLAFYVTRVGCGLAGFHDWQIAPMFIEAPRNCCMPVEWRQWLERATP